MVVECFHRCFLMMSLGVGLAAEEVEYPGGLRSYGEYGSAATTRRSAWVCKDGRAAPSLSITAEIVPYLAHSVHQSHLINV